MKFHATVVFEFSAPDVGEAGKRLNELLEQAQERDLTPRSLELTTPHRTPVTLPAVGTPARSASTNADGAPSLPRGITRR
jgi:hypothetical protein